jgi:hypothetical protein
MREAAEIAREMGRERKDVGGYIEGNFANYVAQTIERAAEELIDAAASIERAAEADATQRKDKEESQ